MHIIQLDENFQFHPVAPLAPLAMQCATLFFDLPAEQRAKGTPVEVAFGDLLDHVAHTLADANGDPELHGEVSLVGLSMCLFHLGAGLVPDDIKASVRRQALATFSALILGAKMLHDDDVAKREETFFATFFATVDSPATKEFVADALVMAAQPETQRRAKKAAAIYVMEKARAERRR